MYGEVDKNKTWQDIIPKYFVPKKYSNNIALKKPLILR